MNKLLTVVMAGRVAPAAGGVLVQDAMKKDSAKKEAMKCDMAKDKLM